VPRRQAPVKGRAGAAGRASWEDPDDRAGLCARLDRVDARRTRYEQIDPRFHLEYQDPEDFDRVAFAMRALHRLRPKRMRVAVYSAVSTLHVESGRSYAEGTTWAMVGIPPHASREHIAYALVELAGVASVPYAVQMLLADDTRG